MGQISGNRIQHFIRYYRKCWIHQLIQNLLMHKLFFYTQPWVLLPISHFFSSKNPVFALYKKCSHTFYILKWISAVIFFGANLRPSDPIFSVIFETISQKMLDSSIDSKSSYNTNFFFIHNLEFYFLFLTFFHPKSQFSPSIKTAVLFFTS